MTFRMRIATLAAAAFVNAAHASDVPTLDTKLTCVPLGGDASLQIDTDRCLKSEQQVREQLTQQWAGFPVADRTFCTEMATMGGTASYVALITCLEMKRDVAKLPADRGLTVRPSSMPTK
jgi:hypothetical protein